MAASPGCAGNDRRAIAGSWSTPARATAAWGGQRWTDELRSLQVPTLLIFGDRDFSPLPDVLEMFELLPNAQLAVLPGTTHVGVTRRPGAVLALITPFLDAS
jgi:pimeloyl-ACP methyl ester carboxylesterase